MEFEKFIFDESAFYPFPTLFLNFSFNGKVQRTNNVIELVILKIFYHEKISISVLKGKV